MRKILFLLLFTVSIFAQNDTISVVKPNLSVISLNKLNIAYRGIPNPISIAVNNARPYRVSGDNLFLNEEGKYVLQPKNGKETKVLLEIATTDSTRVVEEHIFRVKDLPYGALLVNGKGCINGDCVIEMPTKELLNAEITFKLIDFLLDYNINITGFRLQLTNEKGEFLDSVDITGNKIPQDIFDVIASNEKATLILIHKLTFASDLNLSIGKTPVIKIRKIKDKV